MKKIIWLIMFLFCLCSVMAISPDYYTPGYEVYTPKPFYEITLDLNPDNQYLVVTDTSQDIVYQDYSYDGQIIKLKPGEYIFRFSKLNYENSDYEVYVNMDTQVKSNLATKLYQNTWAYTLGIVGLLLVVLRLIIIKKIMSFLK